MIVLFGVVSKTTDADLLGDGLLTGMTLLGDQLLLRCPGALLLLIGWTLDADGHFWFATFRFLCSTHSLTTATTFLARLVL